MKRILIILLLSIMIAGVGYSQDNKLNGWKMKFSVGSSFYSGNVNKFDIRSTGDISHKDSAYEFSFNFLHLYSEADKSPSSREYRTGVKYDFRPYGVFSPFLALSFYSNEFKGINARGRGLVGGKYKFYVTEKSDFSISSALIYDFEQYTKIAGEAQKPSKSIPRLSIRPKLKHKIGKNFSIKHHTFYMPSVIWLNDYLISSYTSFSSKITDKLSMSMSYLFEYVSQPPSDNIKKEDHVFLATLILELGG